MWEHGYAVPGDFTNSVIHMGSGMCYDICVICHLRDVHQCLCIGRVGGMERKGCEWDGIYCGRERRGACHCRWVKICAARCCELSLTRQKDRDNNS